jgi:hypothetical protein
MRGLIPLGAWMPTICPFGYYSNRGTFAGAVTRLLKQACVLGARKRNSFRFRAPQESEQIAKVAKTHKQIQEPSGGTLEI